MPLLPELCRSLASLFFAFIQLSGFLSLLSLSANMLSLLMIAIKLAMMWQNLCQTATAYYLSHLIQLKLHWGTQFSRS